MRGASCFQTIEQGGPWSPSRGGGGAIHSNPQMNATRVGRPLLPKTEGLEYDAKGHVNRLTLAGDGAGKILRQTQLETLVP